MIVFNYWLTKYKKIYYPFNITYVYKFVKRFYSINLLSVPVNGKA